MQEHRPDASVRLEPVGVSNEGGSSPFVFICEHASNFLPAQFGQLGLPVKALDLHIAWDPGALPVARLLSTTLDAALVESRISRLVIDCNRPLDAPDLISPVSETTVVPGNENLSAVEREARVAVSWRPFHDTLAAVIERRQAAGRATCLVSIHSFTPVYKGFSRPWQIGILHDDDVRLSAPLIEALKQPGNLVVGDNEPYSPADRVYFTLERHARSRGLPCAMIEIRNDEVRDDAGQQKWGGMLAAMLSQIEMSGKVKSRPTHTSTEPATASRTSVIG